MYLKISHSTPEQDSTGLGGRSIQYINVKRRFISKQIKKENLVEVRLFFSFFVRPFLQPSFATFIRCII